MKAKKLMGLIAFASAFVSLSAFASTTNGWFGVTVEGTAVTPVNISTNGVGVAESNAIKLTEVAQEDALVFTPDANSTVTNCTDDIYVIGASVVLTPCSTNDFKEVNVSGAKAGVVVGFDDNDVTNYYGYTGNQWYQLDGVAVASPGKATEFYIVLNYRDTNTCFVVGDKLFGPHPMSAGETSALANIKAWGTGSISSVTGAFEVAVAAYGGNKYGSVAEASEAAKIAKGDEDADVTADVMVVNSDGTTEPANTPASNGLSKIVCEALGLPMNDSTANIAVAPAATDVNPTGITLAVNVAGAPEPGAVKYKVEGGSSETKYYDASSVTIPLAPGTYTITPVLK